MDPVEVGGVAPDDWGYNDFRDLVRMMGPDEVLKFGGKIGLGFTLEDKLSARLHFSLPPVDASNGPELNAGSQSGGCDEISKFHSQLFTPSRRRDDYI